MSKFKSYILKKDLFKGILLLFFLTVIILTSSQTKIYAQEEDTVTINLFSVYKIEKLSLFSPEIEIKQNGKTLTGREFTVTGVSGTGKIKIEKHGKETLFNSPLIIRSEAPIEASVNNGKERTFAAPLIIRNTGRRLLVFKRTDLESYIAGVVLGEMPAAPQEALKAQAVAARTFALKNMDRHKKEGFNYCDSTHCQFYRGYAPPGSPHYNAARETKNRILTFEGDVTEGFYHSTCGGQTSLPRDVFGLPSPGFSSIKDRIKGEKKDLCAGSPHYRWEYVTNMGKIEWLLSLEKDYNKAVPLKDIRILKTDEAGRIILIEVIGKNRKIKMSGYDFWQFMASHVGWGTFESAKFTIEKKGNRVTFKGAGLGHGIGMCQMGAIEMAKKGFGWRDILKHYYPKARVTSK